MKKPFFQFNNSFLLWLIAHLGIPAILGLSLFFAPPLRINIQILDLLPKTDMSKIVEADNVLTERNGRETVIIFGSEVFEKAKNTAVNFYNKYRNAHEIESISFYFDADTIAECNAFFYKYRFVIAEKNTLEQLESGNTGAIATDALARAFGAFNYTPLDNIDKDPFLLTDRKMEEFISSSLLLSGNLSIKNDVLSVQKDGIWHVILRMTLTPEAVSVNNIKNNVIGDIYTEAEFAKEKDPELKIYFSGIPFHSYESASGTQNEIAVISVIALAFILFLFFIVFRSPVPIIFSIIDILLSLALATASVFLIFREIHVFTFIFGTTLIGICIDYSIHFFIQWKGNTALKNGNEIRALIFNSMTMCLISSIIGFGAVLFTSFPIFKQFGVFAISGLLSSFLTASCVYPLIKFQDTNKRQFMFLKFKFFPKKNISLPGKFRIIIILILAVIIIAALYINPQSLQIKNDLSSLYKMSPFLEESEKKTAMVLDQASSPVYFIVSGGSAEETLKNEEYLTLRLKEETSKGNLSSFMGITMFVPSEEKQAGTYKAMRALLPLAGAQYEYLGFDSVYEEIFYNEYAAGDIRCFIEDAPLWTGVTNLWIGEIEGDYYSCLLLFDVKDPGFLKSIADEYDFVYLVNIEEIVNKDLDTVTRTIVFFFFAGYFIIALIIFINYPLKDSIKICLVPVLVVLSVLAVLSVIKIPLGFIPISALILVFGLGMDFILYMSGRETKKHKNLTRFAVALSFLTTVLSFGLLSFSKFPPVNTFGLTVVIGLTAAFIFTMLLQRKEEPEGDF